MIEVQEPTAEHECLAVFAGSWFGQEIIHPTAQDPKGGEAVALVQARMDLGGFSWLLTMLRSATGVISHRSHGVYGFDSGAAEYTLAWFDGMGEGVSLMPARGSFVGDSLVLHQSGPLGHFRYSYTATSPDKYTMLLEILSDTEVWSVFLEGTYTRRSSDCEKPPI